MISDKKSLLEYFNLEMVTSVGYRVKSNRGVQFRNLTNQKNE